MTSSSITSKPRNLQQATAGASKPSFLNDGYPNADLLLRSSTPDLTENNGSYPYKSVTEYLDVHYGLISEDFFGSIRDDLQEYKRQGFLNKWNSSRVFKEVRLIPVSDEHVRGKYCYIHCDLELSHPNKEPMFGYLLLFTRGDVADSFLGQVKSQRDDGSNLVIEVEVKLPACHKFQDLSTLYFTMIKDDVFYFKYFHVLKVLNSLTEQSFPMKDFIVYGSQNTHMDQPVYLSENTSFKILDSKQSHTISQMNHKVLDMDESQTSALKAALFEKLAVIYGAPGTGKTYFGVRLVKVLLDNIFIWNTENCTPILVVCQSNQALDHFLENLLVTADNVADGIVRIGGHCQSELIMPFSLKELVGKRLGNRWGMKTLIDKIEVTRQNIKKPYYRHNTAALRAELKTLESQLAAKWREMPKQCKFDHGIQVLKSKFVVGLTSTGAASHRHYLEELRSPIVIIEEAGEMLEAHTLVSMTEHCKHLILIGDIKQLKPMINKFELGRDYFLNVSLFERLLSNGIVKGHCLTTQYRMRPEISSLLRPHIYDVLYDSPITTQQQNVRGLTKNVFFLDHLEEETVVENQGYCNQHEVDMLIRLAHYLVHHQKYSPSKVAIITMYAEQKKIMQEVQDTYPDLQDVEVATVDGYQGRENEIILLSLVRSNTKRDIGFLKEETRICVALSRPRSGLFIMGNMDCLSKNGTWNEVRLRLEANEQIGPELTLQCVEHQTQRQVSTVDDWEGLCPSCSCETTKIDDFDKSVIVEMPSDAQLDHEHVPVRRSRWPTSWETVVFGVFLVSVTATMFTWFGRMFFF